MYIKQALIVCKDQKTDDELKAIMATHHWAPAMIHGFYKLFGEVWEEEKEIGHMADAIWIDGGLTYFDTKNKWVVENFHVPNIYREQEPALLFTPYERRKYDLEKEWWNATVALILHQIPRDYHACGVYYGELEDEFDNVEEAWRESLLAYFNYAPAVEVALGNTEAA